MNPKAIARTALTFLGSGYHRLRATKPVWLALNLDARRRYRVQPATLSPKEQAIVRELRAEGLGIAHLSELVPAGAFDELAGYARAQWESEAVRTAMTKHRAVLSGERPKTDVSKKAFLVNLWPFDEAQGMPFLDLAHPFIRLSLAEPILKIVNAYLGMFSKFRGWRLEATIPMPEGARPRASQRWHRDEEDLKLVKVFLYLNDVDDAAGPFMYVKYSHQGGKWAKLFPMVPPRGSLPMPPNVDDFVPKDDILVSTGRAGTIIFCDTTGLHQGGFAASGVRLMYTSIYTTTASPWPIRYRYPPEFKYSNIETLQKLSPAARYAIENDPHQREPKFYR